MGRHRGRGRLTLVGVPTGIALTGGSVSLYGALPLAETLAILMMLRQRWPVAALLAAVAAVTAMRGAGLVEVGWIWPATVLFAHCCHDRAHLLGCRHRRGRSGLRRQLGARPHPGRPRVRP